LTIPEGREVKIMGLGKGEMESKITPKLLVIKLAKEIAQIETFVEIPLIINFGEIIEEGLIFPQLEMGGIMHNLKRMEKWMGEKKTQRLVDTRPMLYLVFSRRNTISLKRARCVAFRKSGGVIIWIDGITLSAQIYLSGKEKKIGGGRRRKGTNR
jgi:hypothetical protein